VKIIKTGIAMKLRCVECKKQFDIPEDKLDDFNIYWAMSNKGIDYCPKLLCPVCTETWSKK